MTTFNYIKKKLGRFSFPETADKIKIYLGKYLHTNKSISIIDIGAHRGDFIHQIKRHYSIERAILVEPIPELAIYLKSVFHEEGIYIFQNAVSERDMEQLEFQINEYAETSSLLPFKGDMKELANVNTRSAKKEIVVSRTLDSITAECGFDEIDLIKIDVQGVEHLVLNGATRSLKNARFVWIELSFKPLYTGSSVFHDIYAIMMQNEFILLEISPGHRSPVNELLQADALFANPKYL